MKPPRLGNYSLYISLPYFNSCRHGYFEEGCGHTDFPEQVAGGQKTAMRAGNLEKHAMCCGTRFTSRGNVLSLQGKRSENEMPVLSGDFYCSAIQKENIAPGKRCAICKLKLKHNKKE